MFSAAIALGSNLPSRFGGREDNLREAVRRIGALGTVKTVSGFYDTEPVGYTDQPRFLNAALVLETWLEPVELMLALLEVERGMGRERTGVAKGPRVIDLDLLLVGEMVVEDLGADAAASGDGGAAVWCWSRWRRLRGSGCIRGRG